MMHAHNSPPGTEHKMTGSKASAFVFDLSFDVDEKIQTIEEEALPLIYDQHDLDDAMGQGMVKGRAIGFEEGFVQGELKAITTRHLEMQAAFMKIYDTLETILKKEKMFEQTIQEQVYCLVKTIIEKVFPSYCQTHSHNEMLAALDHLMSTFIDPEPITIFIAPEVLEDIQEKIIDMQKRFDQSVQLKTNDQLQPWECSIEWHGGGARWSQEKILNQITALFLNDQGQKPQTL